jgi:hypothetical protein
MEKTLGEFIIQANGKRLEAGNLVKATGLAVMQVHKNGDDEPVSLSSDHVLMYVGFKKVNKRTCWLSFIEIDRTITTEWHLFPGINMTLDDVIDVGAAFIKLDIHDGKSNNSCIPREVK